MENSKNVDIWPETKMSSQSSDSYVERTDVTETESQPQEHIPDNARMESKTIRYDLMFQDNVNNVGTLNFKEQEDELLQICEDNVLKIEEINTIVGSYGTHGEDETNITMPKTTTNKIRKKAPTKRNKKSSQLLVDNKKEDLKKTGNCGKTIKQKTTRKTNKTMLLPANVNKTHKQINDELKKYTKLGSRKNESRVYLKNTVLPSAICIQPNDNEQELSQYHLDNNALQHSDYNSMKCTNQEVMSTNSDPWLLAPTSARNVTLSNNVTNMQTEGCFTNDRQYSTSTDHNWKQNENPYMSSSINFTEPYNLSVSENKACYNVHNPNCMWNSIYNNPRDFTNTIFQQMPTNIASNYITSTAASNNSLNTTPGLFNPFHYQPLQTDSNLKKLCYTSLSTINYGNNSECEMTSMIKGNVMSPQNSDISAWHHVNDITNLRNNNLSIPFNAPVTSWSDILSSYPLYTGNNISASTNTSAQFNDQYSRDTVRPNQPNQYRERENFVNLYLESAFENNLPAIDMHALNPYKDDELTNGLSHERSTSNNVENSIMSDITNLLSETDSAEVSKEYNL